MGYERPEAEPGGAPLREETARGEAPVAPGFRQGAPRLPANLSTLQRSAGNRVVARLVAAPGAAAVARCAPAPSSRLLARSALRSPTGRSDDEQDEREKLDDLEELEELDDRIARAPSYTVRPDVAEQAMWADYWDPWAGTTGRRKPIYTEAEGYVLHPGRMRLRDRIDRETGLIGSEVTDPATGRTKFTPWTRTLAFVVTRDGDFLIADPHLGDRVDRTHALNLGDASRESSTQQVRRGEPRGRTVRLLLHQTLVGGHAPRAPAGGWITFEQGLVTRLGVGADAFGTPREAGRVVMDGLLRCVREAGTSVWIDRRFKFVSLRSEGTNVTATRLRTLGMLKLKWKDDREWKTRARQALTALSSVRIGDRVRRGQRYRTDSAGKWKGHLAAAIVEVALQHVLNHAQQRVYDDFIDQQIKKKAPKVAEALQASEQQLDDELLKDSTSPVYLNFRLKIWSVETPHVPAGGGTLTTLPVVYVEAVEYSRTRWTAKRDHAQGNNICSGPWSSTTIQDSQPLDLDAIFLDTETAQPR
jgi:hypothetical protein